MKNNGNKWIVILGIVIVIVLIITWVLVMENKKEETIENLNTQNTIANEENYVKELNDGTKINTSEALNNIKKYKDLEISNIQFTESNGMTVLLANVKNNGTTRHEAEIVKIEILDRNGNVITDGKPVIGNIEPGETIKLNASITGNVANAKDFRITEIK